MRRMSKGSAILVWGVIAGVSLLALRGCEGDDKQAQNSAAAESPDVGTWAKLAQNGFGCEKWDTFTKVEEIGASGDRAALQQFVLANCDYLQQGTEVWVNDGAPLHAARQVRPRGSVRQFWIFETLFNASPAKPS